MYQTPSSSQIVRRGLGLSPARLEPEPESARCMACATAIPPGGPRAPWKPVVGTFTDWAYLAGSSGVICPDCVLFMANPTLERVQACVANREGAWSLRKDAHRLWLLTDPPAPPFVAMISDARKQHLVWRAAVTLDRDLIRLQLGRAGLTIDRPLALEAAAWARELAQAARAAGIKLTAHHPFAALDRERAHLGHAVARPDIATFAQRDAHTRTLLARLLNLGEGELWALSVLSKVKAEVPLREALITEEEQR
jgi:CRISPR type IV-associated protein Csf1